MTSVHEAIRYAGRPIELNAKAGDHVLIVSDLETPKEIVDALTSAAIALGHEVSLAIYAADLQSSSEPPRTVSDAMAASDIALLATRRGLAHTAATLNAAKSGTRCVFMEGLTLNMLCHGAATADYDRVGQLGSRIAAKWNAGSTVRVRSSLGGDLVAGIAGRRSWEMAGRVFRGDWFGLSGCCAFPDGECGLAPLEGSANGTVVFDMSTQSLGPLSEPIALEVIDSRIVEVRGGRQADQLRAELETAGDANAYFCPAEIAIGINDAAQETGLLREDKKLLGTCHIAYGANSDIGGHIESALHIDGLIRKPTIEIDGEAIVVDGVIVPALAG
ncbi:MAG TPA: aminopeptidase [Solirubrobacteraceae bacterium]|jgi:leucyl aminopeptidase (aminopeptidase T)|nr:aminopeptidase [Solirubrobacteraceae bacterium]